MFYDDDVTISSESVCISGLFLLLLALGLCLDAGCVMAGCRSAHVNSKNLSKRGGCEVIKTSFLVN